MLFISDFHEFNFDWILWCLDIMSPLLHDLISNVKAWRLMIRKADWRIRTRKTKKLVGGVGGCVVCGGSHFSVFITSPLVTLVRAVGICMLNVNPHVGIDRTPTSKNSVRWKVSFFLDFFFFYIFFGFPWLCKKYNIMWCNTNPKGGWRGRKKKMKDNL